MSQSSYVGVRIEGGLLPAGLLSRLATSRTPVAGHDSQDYGLAAGESVREAANRVWAYLRTAWVGYRDALERLPESDRATSLTRDRWLQILLDQLGYGRVPPTPAGGITVDGKSFPVSHLWGQVPIHLLGARIDLDRLTAGAAGAARQAPQSLVQELLNRSEEHLWAILSNGSTFRVLRDSTSLVGSAYVEFDLEAIFDGELFSDFLMLFTLCHATRLEVRDPEIGAASCRLEQWRGMAVEDGSRALDQLREGVVEALQGLGTGFLAHPDNATLRERVESGELSLDDYNHALLRVVYRLLFSFVAEDRGALLSPAADPHARERYTEYFSTDRLRRTARRRRGGRHGDRWQALQLVWRGLGSAEGLPELGIAGIGGLFEAGDLDFLGGVSLSNEALLSAVRALSVIRERGSGQAQVVNYRDLDAEELGSIYEALLEYVPSWDGARRAYTLGTAAGNARKTTGSYYTPTSLIESLLDTALDPVLDAAEKRGAGTGDPVAELLAVTVVDPACGSGHFLVGAARRIAKRVAAARTGDPEPPPERVRAALREVVGRCIYGVDLNPLAAELAKVSLWLDAMEPGKPLAFLDAQVKVGNALVGATPLLLDRGLPQEAFKPIEGDDKKTVAALAKRNKQEAGGQGSLFGAEEARTSNADLIEAAAGLVGAGLSLGDIHVQQQRLKQYADSDAYRAAKLHADAWCAAFVWPRTPAGVTCPTTATLQSMVDDPDRWLGPDRSPRAAAIVTEVERLAAEYRFFHWHLEFPSLFPTEKPTPDLSRRGHTINDVTGWYGGFDAVLGNPPWDQSEVDETEWFAASHPEIAHERRATRRRVMIAELEETEPATYQRYLSAKRRPAALAHFAKDSGEFERSSGGRINLYRLFAERADIIGSGTGNRGLVLPTGIVSELAAAPFCRSLVEAGRLVAVHDFTNRLPMFPAVPTHFRFCLITFSGKKAAPVFEVSALNERAIGNYPRSVQLSPADIKLISAETLNVPLFPDRTAARISLHAYKSGRLFGETGLQTKQGFVNLTSDDAELRTFESLATSGGTLEGEWWVDGDSTRFLPLCEAKLFGSYARRTKTFRGVPREGRFSKKATPLPWRQDDPDAPLPRYWTSDGFVKRGWPSKRPWVLAGKEIMNDLTSSRTSVFSVQPYSALAYTCQVVVGDSLPATDLLHYLGCLNSVAFDFLVRQKKTGPHLTATILRQVPVIPPGRPFLNGDISEWDVPRITSLLAADGDVADLLAQEGIPVSNHSVTATERETIQAELDAAYFILFGCTETDVEYVLDRFAVLAGRERKTFGEFRSKRLILDAYDRLAAEGAVSSDRG